MSFTVPSLLSDKDMSYIVCTGFESGSYGSVRIEEYLGPKEPPAWVADDDRGYRHMWGWDVGDGIEVKDRYGDGMHGFISRESLQRGLQILSEKHPRLLAQLVSDQYDVIAADALLQAAAFGEVIYG